MGKRRILAIENELSRLTLDMMKVKAQLIGAPTIQQAIHELTCVTKPDDLSADDWIVYLAGVSEAVTILRRLQGEDLPPQRPDIRDAISAAYNALAAEHGHSMATMSRAVALVRDAAEAAQAGQD